MAIRHDDPQRLRGRRPLSLWTEIAAGLQARVAPRVDWLGTRWQAQLRRSHAMAPATMVALVFVPLVLVLDVTPQGRDVIATQFRHSIDATTPGDAGRMLALTVALAVCSFVAWVVSRKAVIDAFGDKPADWGPRWRQLWLLMLPRLLWATPFLIVVWPLLREPERTWPMLIAFFAVTIVAAGVGGLLLFGLLRRRRATIVFARTNEWDNFPWLHGIGPVAAVGFVFLAVLIAFKVGVARALGAPALAFLAVAFITAMLGFLYHVVMFRSSDMRDGMSVEERAVQFRRGAVRFLPLLTGLAVVAMAMSWFNDNHAVAGRRGIAMGPATGRMTAQQAIDAFVAQLPPLRDPGVVPVVFVATAGGASRAAYWTGEVLGRLDAQTGGTFGRHVFAISSVSGGTLGAATYLAERAEATPPGELLLRRMRNENGADHLSPVVAGMLFPDFLQRFLPVPWLPDRAEYLERSFEASWAPLPGSHAACRPDGSRGPPGDAPPASRFARPLLELWSCAALRGDGTPVWVPLLLANGTRAEDGRRIITSSVDAPSGTFGDALDFHRVFGFDVPLSVVVTNSARFPVVSPSGTLPPRASDGGSRGHIIDGGYFENGGIATLVEFERAVGPALEAALKARFPGAKPRFILLEIDNDDGGDPARRAAEIAGNRPGEPAAEVASLRGFDALLPVFGLYQTRGARGTLEAIRARREIDAVEWRGHSEEYALFQLCPLWAHDRVYSTEMNWAMSDQARDRLDSALIGGSKDPGCRWNEQMRSMTAHFPGPAATPVPATTTARTP